MAMTDYSERIPAAIARGKELLHPTCPIPGCKGKSYVSKGGHVLTAGEVALAARMAELYELGVVYEVTADGNVPDRALVAFVEKIERLS